MPSILELSRRLEPVYPSSWENRTLDDEASGNEIFLDNTYPSILKDSLVALDNGTSTPHIYQVCSNTEASRSDFTLSAKVSRLDLNSNTDFGSYTLRNTTVLAASERLELADLPIEDPVEKNGLWLDRLYLGLQHGQKVILTGERRDLPGVVESEAMTLLEVNFNEGYNRISLYQSPAKQLHTRHSEAERQCSLGDPRRDEGRGPG